MIVIYAAFLWLIKLFAPPSIIACHLEREKRCSLKSMRRKYLLLNHEQTKTKVNCLYALMFIDEQILIGKKVNLQPPLFFSL